MLALIIVQGFIVLLLAVLVVGLLRSHAEILRRLHELGAGVYEDDDDHAGHAHSEGVTMPVELTPRQPDIRTQPGVPEPRQAEMGAARDLSGLSPSGSAAAVGVAGTNHTTLLAFLSSGCGTCADFWRAFGAGEATVLPGRDTRLVVVTKGPENESQSSVQALAPPAVTTIMSTAAYEDYEVPVNPYFILVDGPSSRVIGEGAAATWTQVLNLLGQSLDDAGIARDRIGSGAGSGSAHSAVPSAEAARLNGQAREARADAELRAAGINPGHASLYPDRLTGEGED